MYLLKSQIFVIILIINFCGNFAYKPVVLLHGILTGSPSMTLIAERIQELHPGTKVYNIAKYGGWDSLEPLWHQVQEIGNDIMNISKANPKGIHLLGYSQGGLIARAILETFPDHGVHNFISLSSPQGGQYGTAFLRLIFPNLVCETAYELFYSRLGQHTSVGNYWYDPDHTKLYFKYNVFLPFVNNAVNSSRSVSFKQGLLNLKKLILIGGPDDGIITPWQSSRFGYFGKNLTVVDLKEQDLYKNDLLGLKYLDKKKRLHIYEVPGVRHFDWHLNIKIIDTYVLPHLD